TSTGARRRWIRCTRRARRGRRARPPTAVPAVQSRHSRNAMSTMSAARRQSIVDALRRGTVPQHGLDALAVGLDRFETAIDADLETVANGGASFRAVRGEYGSGKTFFVRWIAERARRRGFATSEVQVSETETPLHRHETVYRRIVERLSTPEQD